MRRLPPIAALVLIVIFADLEFILLTAYLIVVAAVGSAIVAVRAPKPRS